MSTQQIHETQPTLTYGTPLSEAKVAVLLMHGRGATAESMRELAQQLPTDEVAYILPQAKDNTWYANSGFAPFEVNQPNLDSAWHTMELKLEEIADAGIPLERTIVGGFSQGACLSSEFIAQHAQRYGGLLVLSGALMGDENTSRDYDGSLNGTPVFVGGADDDPWVTEKRLKQTVEILAALGGDVSTKIHNSSDHTIRATDIDHATRIIEAALQASA